jgi:non-ribosomal peptide synthetase component F
LLMEEFVRLYTAYTAAPPGAQIHFPESSTIQYADFAVWQRELPEESVFRSQIEYWKKQLAGLSILHIPGQQSSIPSHSSGDARQLFEIPCAIADALRDLSQRTGTTLFMTLLGGFQALLHRLTAQDDIGVGISVANRNRAELEHLVGFFVNILILRTNLSGNPTFQELLQRVREVALEAYNHQDLPFEKLVQILEPERGKHSTPLVTAAFDYQKDTRHVFALPGLAVEFLELANGRPQFDLTLRVLDEGDRLNGRLDYKASLFGAESIEQLLRNYIALLREVAFYPQLRLLEIPLSGEAKRKNSFSESPPQTEVSPPLFAFELEE